MSPIPGLKKNCSIFNGDPYIRRIWILLIPSSPPGVNPRYGCNYRHVTPNADNPQLPMRDSIYLALQPSLPIGWQSLVLNSRVCEFPARTAPKCKDHFRNRCYDRRQPTGNAQKLPTVSKMLLREFLAAATLFFQANESFSP